MYYSEISKIIEAGLERDKEKVVSFAKLLAKKLEADGEKRASTRITTILERKNYSRTVTDSLVPPPVDQESSRALRDIDYTPEASKLILNPAVEAKLKDFMSTIQNKSRLEDFGLDFNMSLLPVWGSGMRKNICCTVHCCTDGIATGCSTFGYFDFVIVGKYIEKHT